MELNGIYPVNIPKTMERSTMLLMGKSTISIGPFSIANCLFTTRGYFINDKDM